jgi:Uncharacterized protein conserved in bacteria
VGESSEWLIDYNYARWQECNRWYCAQWVSTSRLSVLTLLIFQYKNYFESRMIQHLRRMLQLKGYWKIKRGHECFFYAAFLSTNSYYYHRYLKYRYISNLEYFHYSYLFYLLFACVDGYCCASSHAMTRTHTVGLLWMKDWPVSQTCACTKHTTLTTDRQTCLWQDSNPQSQQARGHIHTP